jgi:CelD/BcsL family acetyltransferase involved in cellulose biosynthesis
MPGKASAMRFGDRAPRMAAGLRVPARARVEIITDLAAAETPWHALEAGGVLTPYQRFDWISAWQRHVGAAEGVEPLIVVGRGDGDAQFLLPLGKYRRGPFTVARFLGGKHANFNFGLWTRDGADAGALDDILAALRASAPDVDALVLLNQPESWDGLANPLAVPARQPSPSFGYRLALNGKPYATLIAERLGGTSRRRLRNKEHRLGALPGYCYQRATTGPTVDRLLDAFVAQKAARLSEQGIDNIFGRCGVVDFLRAACHQGLAHGRPTIELHGLECDAEVLAVFGLVNDGRRFSCMFNSYTLSEHARQSPGLLLLLHVIEDCAARGAAVFDLGVGEADYKTHLCDETETLFDAFLPLTARGRALTSALALAARVKRSVKHSPPLMRLAQLTRRLRAR